MDLLEDCPCDLKCNSDCPADDDEQLLSVGIKMFSGQYGTDYGGLFAATSVTIIPVVIAYLVFQKQFIAGIATGSGK